MSKISVWNYAICFWKRDIIFSLFTGIFATCIFFFLILSLRLQIAISGRMSFSSIEGLKSSPDLLFYLSVISLGFLILGTIFPRSGDLAIMMAVGGNQWVCVQIHLYFIALQTFPAFLLANLLNFTLIPELFFEKNTMDLILIEAYSLGVYVLLSFFLGIPSVLLATRKDPYSTIRRLK